MPSASTPVPVPSERLRPAVVWWWWCTEGVVAMVTAGLAFWLLRPWLAEHWSAWSPDLDLALRVALGVWLSANLLAPPLQYVRWRFCYDGDLLVLRHGVLFVAERIVPVRRMQHVDLLRGPVERLFGLATLVVHTAGDDGATFRVPGLAAARAQELRDRILEARGDGRR